jgi:DHA1 family multidrug resistance protein-like MFS transporter
MVLRVMLGVFSGFGAISVALVTHRVPEEQVGRVVGTLQSVQILSAAAGPAVGGVLFDSVGLRPAFLITAAICAVGLVLVTLAYREIGPDDPGERRRAADPQPLSAVAATPGLFPLLALLFFASLVDRSFGLIVPLVLQESMAPGAALGTWSGLTVSGGAFAGAASAIALGALAAGGRPRRLIQMGLATGAILLGAMAMTGGPGLFAALRIAYGLAAGGLVTLAYTIASRLVDERSRATGYGFRSSGALLGAAVGPLAAGLLAPLIGFRGFLLGAAVVLLALAAAARHGVRREREAARAGEAPRPYIPLPR